MEVKYIYADKVYLKETVFPCMDKDFRLHFNWR